MKQLGNLAIVCARRKNLVFQILDGTVAIHLGEGPQRQVLSTEWDDDERITSIIHELNFGKYKEDTHV